MLRVSQSAIVTTCLSVVEGLTLALWFTAFLGTESREQEVGLGSCQCCLSCVPSLCPGGPAAQQQYSMSTIPV